MRKNSSIFQNATAILLAFVLIFGNALTLNAAPARLPCILDLEYEYENPPETIPAPEIVIPISGEPTLEALFNPMPIYARDMGRSPRRYELGRDISFHMCWCWGIRVLTYDPDEDFNGWQYDRFTLWQDETTRNLIITDNEEFVALFDIERDITSTLGFEGTRSHRFRTFSVYFHSDGYVTLAHPEMTVHFRENWVWQWELFSDDTLPVSLDYVMELDDRFMMLIGYNFFQIGAWNQLQTEEAQNVPELTFLPVIPQDGFLEHLIEPGQSLASIAMIYWPHNPETPSGRAIRDQLIWHLAETNNLNPEILFAGTWIRIYPHPTIEQPW